MSRRQKVVAKLEHQEVAAVADTSRFIGPAALLLISIVTFLVYLPAMNGKQIWDDDFHITKPELRSLHGLSRIWFELGATQQYYPLLHSAFWLEHKLWGDSVRRLSPGERVVAS